MSENKKFFKQMAYNVFWRQGDTDHPDCPECNSTMNFHGGDDISIGEGYWECSSCGYSFTESDLDEFDVLIFKG